MHIGTMVEFAFALVGKLDVINKHSFNDFKLRVGELCTQSYFGLKRKRLEFSIFKPLKILQPHRLDFPVYMSCHIKMHWMNWMKLEHSNRQDAALIDMYRQKSSSGSRSWCSGTQQCSLLLFRIIKCALCFKSSIMLRSSGKEQMWK